MGRLNKVDSTPRYSKDPLLLKILKDLATAINGLIDGQLDIAQLAKRTSAPAPLVIGMIAYADGVGWNPGSGEGLYVYKSTGWKFLG